MNKMNKFYITTPIYYVNAAPHIGHAYTTIAADVLAFYWRLKLGEEKVFYLTGTDEHGQKIYEKALAAGISPQEFTDEVSDQFKNAWLTLDIEYNQFIRTTDPEHVAFVQGFLLSLKEKGALYEDDYEGLYCVGCEKFLTEKELIDGVCQDHKIEPQKVQEKNWFFKLSEYTDQIVSLIESDELLILPERSKKEVLGLLRQGIPDFPVTRSKEKVQWGIEVPWDNTQLFYVWADALTNYISTKDPQRFWPADVQVIGKDILKFHAIYWIAMLIAGEHELPKKLFGHGYFTINGEKMSKTIGNVIDPIDMVNEFGVDATKYLLLIQFPFGQDGDIEKDKFVEHYNAYLANSLGNLFNRVITLLEKNYESIIPSQIEHSLLADKVKTCWADYTRNMEEDLQLYSCLQIINGLVTECDQHISNTELWNIIKQDKEKGAYELYGLLETLRHISWMIRPFMKHTSDQMFTQLGIFEDEIKKYIDIAQQWGGLSEGTVISKGEILFARKQ